MEDTSAEAKRKQYEVIFSKTPQERLLMGLEMMEDMRLIVLRSIRENNPGISETDIKIEFIRRYYSKDLGAERLADVINWIRNTSHPYSSHS